MSLQKKNSTNNTISTIKNYKRKGKGKTIKNYQKLSLQSYSIHYKKTKRIPRTNIINYMKLHFETYRQVYDKLEQQGKYVLYLDDCFLLEDTLVTGKRIYSYDSPIQGNPSMSLDKLIAYAFYMKTKYAFVHESNGSITSESSYLDALKYQMGKDIRRDKRVINGKKYDLEYYSDTSNNNYDIADMFYQLLIETFYAAKSPIDYNTINKIALLSCQNMFNLLTDLISIKLQELLEPEMNSVFRPVKSANIVVTPDKKTMELIFDSELIISRDQEPVDPEYPCGKVSFILFIDFDKNTFAFSQFKLSYDINTCGPEINTRDNQKSNTSPLDALKRSVKLEYAIPVAIGIGGIIATPFLLGALI